MTVTRWRGPFLACLCLLSLLPSTGKAADFEPGLRRHVRALASAGPRPAGSPGEEKSARYLERQFRALGLAVQVEPFAVPSFEITRAELSVGGLSLRPAALGLDPYAAPATADGFSYEGGFAIVDPDTDMGKWPKEIRGKAVLTTRWEDPSLHFRILLQEPRCIAYLSLADWEKVRVSDRTSLSLRVEGRRVTGRSRNVVARLGAPPPAPQVLVCAHLDAYRRSPGANDDATGLAALLELARHFAGTGLPAGVGLTFVAFGAEERGTLGSRCYVARHAEEMAGYALALALDNLGGEGAVLVERNGGNGAPSAAPGVSRIPEAYRTVAWEGEAFPWRLTPPVSLFGAFTAFHPLWLQNCIDTATKGLPFPVAFSELQGSDQLSFAQAGLATSGVSAVNDVQHTARDTESSVQYGRAAQCAEVTARILRRVLDHLKETPTGTTPGERP